MDDTASPPRFAQLAGTSMQNGYQFYLVKVDTAGDAIWNRMYGSSNHMNHIIRASDSMLTCIGYTTEYTTSDYRLMRIQPSGVLFSSWAFGGNTSQEIGQVVLQDSGGRYLLAGETRTAPDSSRTMTLVRLSAQGIVQWGRTLPPGSSGEALAIDGDSVVFVYGTADSTDSVSGSDFVIVRTDSNGLQPVSRRFTGSRPEYCSDAVRISHDLTILVGSVYIAETETWNVFVLATNDAGDSLWSRNFGTIASDFGTSVIQTMDHDTGFVIAGWSNRFAGQHRGMIMKINREGDSLWTFYSPDSSASEFNAVVQDIAWRYHVAGYIQTNFSHGYYLVTEPDPHSPGEHSPFQFSLLNPAQASAIDSNQVLFEWQETADPDSADSVEYALELAFDTAFSQVNVIAPLDTCRFLWEADTDDVEFCWRVTAFDQQGNSRLCRERYRRFRLAIPDSSSSFNLLSPDSGSALTRPLGEFRWSRAYDPDANDSVIYAIHFVVGDTGMTFPGLMDTFINISFVNNPIIGEADTVIWYVSAQSFYAPMDMVSPERWTFISWSAPADETADIPLEFGLAAPFPNPFNSSTTLRYSVDRMEAVELRIFSLDGRFVANLTHGLHTPGRYEVQWNAHDAASGVYFARLQTSERYSTAKLLLLK